MYSKLLEIIRKEAILKQFDSSKNTFHIKETDKLSKCKNVTLIGFEDENKTFCFELDSKNIKCNKLHKLSPYFNDGLDLDKGNDAIIFAHLDNKNHIFICELKDDSKSNEIIKQLKSSTCFIDYLKSIFKNIYGINIDSIPIYYLLFSSHGNNLRPTGKSRAKPKEIDGLKIFFNNCQQEHHIKKFIN